MAMSGHKTASVFRHYDIVNEADLRKAVEKQAAFLEKSNGLVTLTGTLAAPINPRFPD